MIYGKLNELKKYQNVNSSFKEAFAFFEKWLEQGNFSLGKIEVSEHVYMNVMEYDTKPLEGSFFEAHQEYIDIQVILKGTESFYITNKDDLKLQTSYQKDGDFALFSGIPTCSLILQEGNFVICFPEDGHTPSIATDIPTKVLKVVIKVRV